MFFFQHTLQVSSWKMVRFINTTLAILFCFLPLLRHLFTCVGCKYCLIEIPTALEIIGKGAEQDMSRPHIPMRRILLSSFLRLIVGYLFLFSLFVVVVQESTVINIFFNILGLEFVENIDDVLFALFKRGEFCSTSITNIIPLLPVADTYWP